jgi:hypothetical protein
MVVAVDMYSIRVKRLSDCLEEYNIIEYNCCTTFDISAACRHITTALVHTLYSTVYKTG